MKNPKMWMLKKLVLVALINKTIFLDAYVKTQSHQFLALEILPRVMLPVFRFQVLKMKLLISATPKVT